jgi:hypothetical protein
VERNQFRPFVGDQVADAFGPELVVAYPERFKVIPRVIYEVANILVSKLAFACVKSSSLKERTFKFFHSCSARIFIPPLPMALSAALILPYIERAP